MTTAEFWVSEAENEGKGRSGGDVAEDFYTDLAKEEAKEEERLYDTVRAFDYLEGIAKDWIEHDPDWAEDENFPMPVKVIKVLDVQFTGQVMHQKTSMRVLAKAEDGQSYVYDLWYAYWSGSYLDPPEEDGDITWIAAKYLIL